MPEETETVTGNPGQEENTENQKDNTESNSSDNNVEACDLKTNLSSETQREHTESPIRSNLGPKSPEAMATESFLLHEQGSYERESYSSGPGVLNEPIPHETNVSAEPQQVPEPEQVPQSVETTEPRTPANSEASESGAPLSGDEPQDLTPPQVVQVSLYSETVIVAPVDEPTTINGDTSEESLIRTENEGPNSQSLLTNGQGNDECKLEHKGEPEPHPTDKVLIDTIANELRAEDYKLPDVVEVKKHFEFVEPAQNGASLAPPKKGVLSTRIDSQSVKQAYEDVRYDGSETQWAVFKFEGPTIVTSATGSDFSQFKNHFGEDNRAFGYIRIQTGDEMSKRAKFLFVTWIGPSVSVLKRAKMSTDKALMKGILSNFAVELQTENISDINLQNFETELDKAAGAHYGTGVRG